MTNMILIIIINNKSKRVYSLSKINVTKGNIIKINLIIICYVICNKYLSTI